MPPTPVPSNSWVGWDIARGITMVPGSTTDGYVLDGWGGLHPFGNAHGMSSPGYFPNSDLANGVVMTDTAGGYVSLATGAVLAFGDAPQVTEDMPGIPLGRGLT